MTLKRTLFVLPLVACIAGGCSDRSSASTNPAAFADDGAAITGNRAVMVVHGMSCPLCANNVDKTLAAVPGVTSVLVDMGSGRAAVTLDGTTKVTRGQLAKAVDKSGFTLKSIEIP
ncbi:MAG: heavy-metal-associated domain-containing protein [Phycisphaerales bacterium]